MPAANSRYGRVQGLVLAPRWIGDNHVHRSVRDAGQPERVLVEEPNAVIADKPGIEGGTVLG